MDNIQRGLRLLLRLLIALTLLLSFLLTVPRSLAVGTEPADQTPTPTAQLSDEELEHEAIRLINLERENRQLRPLVTHSVLMEEADRYNSLLQAADIITHTLPGQLLLPDRIKAAGYGWTSYYGEVLAAGDPYRANPAAVVQGWLGSKGHKDILLDPRPCDIGVSYIAGFWDGTLGCTLPIPPVKPQEPPKRAKPVSTPTPTVKAPRKPPVKPTATAKPRP